VKIVGDQGSTLTMTWHAPAKHQWTSRLYGVMSQKAGTSWSSRCDQIAD